MTRETSFLQMQARTQRFTLGTPKEIKVAPDGDRVLFLRSPSGEERRHSLWQLDLATGKESVLADPAVLLADGDEELSAEERARRERSRLQASGIVGNATDAEARIVAFALSGRLYVTDALTGHTRQLDTATPVVDPRPNPTGTHVAYVSGNALRVVNVDGTDDRALAEPEGENRAYGLAEFIAAEEMGRSRGYWWSPDGQRLLVSHTDRSAVHKWHISDPANPAAEAHTVHYPAAGTPNVTVQLVVLGLDGSRVAVDWTGSEYLATVHWSAGGPPLIGVQTRDQRTMQIRAVDPDTGGTKLVHEQTDPHWVDVVAGAPAWTSGGKLVRVVAADDAYRLVVDGDEVTDLPLQVRSVLHVADDVLFTASAEDPAQVHVYRAGSGGVSRLSSVEGVSSATRAGAVTVLTSWRMAATGPEVTVLRDGEPIAKVESLAVTPSLEPKVIRLTLGERKLQGALMFPTGHEPGSGKLPVLLDPYGGPHAQRVLSSRNAYLTSQWLADQGFAVLVIDGRGTPGRGPVWEREIAFDFADVTLIDQVDGLHAAARQYPDLDLSRVGIRGWSYGGYLAALAVLRRPDVFQAAIAGAPVTDWRLYDTHYTERYLGHPDTHPEVYERNSLPADAPNLERSLMIIHGLADDNVVVAHSLRLSAALVAAGRPHTLLPLPNVTHMTPQDETTAENFLLLQTSWLKDALG
ncbi:S9 family peptidase [Kibdelosporangium phytohabitans]|uniref:Peptidase S9 n=1 Tax=Kibdelosporangium phytohabitans TaxID=860235 RepID=A0A0N9HSS4_9PSEU|nr:prolyl oligopeptidase family serine peptidase [Kibdelosporangium phytohabitans]ALG08069.1 peptidase S9 [Kibdelosporangium phytohabitans]MBE1470958.1 dipeptidyl-peptidase-4 [Kibdelosporangium phytohabitans]